MELVRYLGTSHFLNMLKCNGVQFTYEVLPKKMWTFAHYKFMLKYSNMLFQAECIKEEYRRNKLKQKSVFMRRALVKNLSPKLNVLKGQIVKSFSLNNVRSRSKFMLKNKEHVDSEFVKEKKIKSKFTDDWKRDKELNEVEKERIGLVYEFLRSMKTTEKEILGFRKNMCLPFKLDYLIGYQIGRVS